ncbi:MAG: DUF1592 domain-containing protein [Verrucomicrobiae bacterium]|nr:DUF1592 domain-containing protein [Verrucomicrobiae bacterium]
MRKKFGRHFCALLGGFGVAGFLMASETEFAAKVQPLLANYCYDCHGDGAAKGNVTFDGFKSHTERTRDTDFWLNVLRNLRAEVMPPAKKERPTADELAWIERWIKSDVFKLDPLNPDPGRVTLRRLNRVEYQNTIRDLMGVEFRAFEEFPPDDTGYGFDNIGDVLATSPLLLEKYMDAAETIVSQAVPVVSRVVAEQRAGGGEFKSADGKTDARSISFYQAATVSRVFQAAQPGEYRLVLDANVSGAFDFDPGRMKLTVRLGDEILLEEEHKWQDGRKVNHEFTRELPAGEHRVSLNLEPLVPEEQKKTRVDFRLRSVTLQGPLAPEQWVHPPNYDRFFTRDEPPTDPAERRGYAGEILDRFASLAFRRPVEERTVTRLTGIAEDEYSRPGRTFEAGVARAMVAVLASPRFLFRTEGVEPESAAGRHPNLDEYSLASRLSYFLWSTMPDGELFDLAARGELRKHQTAQVHRMLADRRAGQFVENFVGQWLLARDVEGISINERSVLARESAPDREQEKLRARFAALRDLPAEQLTSEQQEELEALRASFRRRRGPTVELTTELRRAMRRETEATFEHVLREDRQITELIDANYAFLNEPLAGHYGVPDVSGEDFRKVALPPDSPRGGVLTQGSVLVVTSNPTRTSPVKRGVFLLDQILGTPAPPPPADVPDLEEAEKEFKDREPTLRETLERHRSQALCKSCHDRMDPLGLALESFNALGMWREMERGHPVDPGGVLITGERFADIRELKRILATERRLDFYRCLTGKLMTYALGRGIEFYDTQAVDDIVARLQREDGRFSALLLGVIESAPFQKRRAGGGPVVVTPENE